MSFARGRSMVQGGSPDRAIIYWNNYAEGGKESVFDENRDAKSLRGTNMYWSQFFIYFFILIDSISGHPAHPRGHASTQFFDARPFFHTNSA